MKKIKILLGDPRHGTAGVHSNFVPVGIGYIGSNLIKQFENKEYKVELKLETDATKIFSLLKKWKPDIVGISNYIWNSDLSYLICSQAKKTNPNARRKRSYFDHRSCYGKTHCNDGRVQKK